MAALCSLTTALLVTALLASLPSSLASLPSSLAAQCTVAFPPPPPTYRGLPPACQLPGIKQGGGCYAENVLYPGNDINDGRSLLLGSAGECYTACKNRQGCVLWNWQNSQAPSPGECWLKHVGSLTSPTGREWPGWVAGRELCEVPQLQAPGQATTAGRPPPQPVASVTTTTGTPSPQPVATVATTTGQPPQHHNQHTTTQNTLTAPQPTTTSPSITDDKLQSCKDVVIKWTLWDTPPGLASTLYILVEEELEGWQVILTFNKHFTKLNFFRDGDSKDTSGSVFTVTNAAWTGVRHPGDHLKFSLLGDYTSGGTDPIQLLQVSLQGRPVARNCPN